MKIKLLRLLSAAICFMAFGLGADAQTGNTNYFQPSIFPLAPNSTAFAKFGNYPVNLYSGLPDISIPLYTVEAGGLSVPITLSYHASGNKVADVASWVGLGWSVNTGGSITRSVMGLPDDNGYLQGDWASVLHLKTASPVTNSDLDYFHATIATRGWDNMPDIFSYQVPGYSGKFFFDGTNKYKIEKIPFSPINITGLTGINGTGGFNITDDHGNKFTLGHTYTESTATLGGGTLATNGISAWMLEQMISQNRRDTIGFSYTNHTFQYPDGVTETITVEDSYQQLHSPFDAGYVNSDRTPVILNNPSTVTEQQLQTITFKNGKVDFILSTAGRSDVGDLGYPSKTVYSLARINVSTYNFGTRQYEVQKSIVFNTSYFNAGISGAQRLRLDGIDILDKAGAVVQHYSFTYNNTLNLPAYQSPARDFWGYYNGSTQTDLIPKTTVQINTPMNIMNPITYVSIGSGDSTSRNPDSNFMQANILNRIDYPTGGFSTFAYQTNRYIDSAGHLQLAGGLRIKSISSFDGPSSSTPVLTKTYQYNTARANFINNGGPFLYSGIFQNSQTYQYFAQEDGGFVVWVLATKRVRHFFAQPNEDLAPDAIPVAYSNVTEYEGTPTANIGKTVYTFRDSPRDTWQTAYRTGIPITYSFSYSRGQLLEKKEYQSKTGGLYQVVKDETNAYTAFPTRYYDGVGLAIGQANYNDGYMMGSVSYPGGNSIPDDVTAGTYVYNYYDIVSDDNFLIGSTSKTYDLTDTTQFVSSSVAYNYGDTTHLQIASVNHTDSKGNTHISSTKYAFDYLNGGTTTNNAVLDSMLSRHMYAEPIEKWDSLRNVTTSVNAVTGAQLNQFQTGSIGNTIVPAKVSTLSVSAPLTNFAHSHIVSGVLTGDSRYAQMISFDRFDTKNNITQYTTRNSTPVSILWDYMYEFPVAQIKNATNGTNTEVGYTSFEAPRLGGLWTYSGAPITDVTAPTGSWVYPLSAGSVTTTNLENTKSYVLSLWSNNGAPTVYTGSYITGSPLRSANGWTYYEYTIPAFTSGITVSGTPSIDDLRLYPIDAQMTSYTYDPTGLRQIADTKGAINYFEYDYFARLKNVKDWNGNIVKNYGYHTFDQTVGNDAQPLTTFTRNNCPAGTTPQTTTYSVAANTYLASTKASANAEAVYDLNVNGQALANDPHVCGCPITTISYTLVNSTGLSGFQVTFSGIATPFNFPSSGSTVVQVPAGTYATVTTNSVGSGTHTFTMGARPPQSGVHSGSFTSVTVATGSSDLTLTIN